MFKKALKFGFSLVKKRPRGWVNFILNQTAAMAKSSYVPALPPHITIEPTNICDQKCPVCETGAGILGRPQGMMTLENFRKIIDKIYRDTNTLMFYGMGEPFLNKDAYEMIKYAKSKGIYVETCTNGNFVDGQKLVESGIDQISFQIGGVTQATHGVYRCNGKLEKILRNVRAAVAAKKESDAKTTITLGFIVMKHNEREVSDFWKLVKEVGADSGELVKPCVRNFEQGKIFLTKNEKYWIYDKSAFEKGVLRLKFPMDKNSCWWIWHSTVIT